MEVNHLDKVLNITVSICSALYLLDFEVYALSIGISGYFFEVYLHTVPMLVQHIDEEPQKYAPKSTLPKIRPLPSPYLFPFFVT